jgi:hypothetical protein
MGIWAKQTHLGLLGVMSEFDWTLAGRDRQATSRLTHQPLSEIVFLPETTKFPTGWLSLAAMAYCSPLATYPSEHGAPCLFTITSCFHAIPWRALGLQWAVAEHFTAGPGEGIGADLLPGSIKRLTDSFR